MHSNDLRSISKHHLRYLRHRVLRMGPVRVHDGNGQHAYSCLSSLGNHIGYYPHVRRRDNVSDQPRPREYDGIYASPGRRLQPMERVPIGGHERYIYDVYRFRPSPRNLLRRPGIAIQRVHRGAVRDLRHREPPAPGMHRIQQPPGGPGGDRHRRRSHAHAPGQLAGNGLPAWTRTPAAASTSGSAWRLGRPER